MQYLFTFIIPAIAIVLTYRYFGWGWGLAALALYFGIAIFVKLPDILLIQGAKKFTKDPQKGLDTMEKALKTGRLRTAYILYYSFMCLKAEELDRAERILNLAAHKKMKPEEVARATVNRALLLWKRDDLPKAISILEEQLKLGKDKDVYGALGQFLILNGQLQRAMEVNQAAYAFDKYDESIVDNLALNYRLVGDLDSSWHLYKELTSKRLGVPVPYYNCGETLYALGRKEEAVDMMQNALGYSFSKLAVIKREEIETRIDQISAEIKEIEKN